MAYYINNGMLKGSANRNLEPLKIIDLGIWDTETGDFVFGDIIFDRKSIVIYSYVDKKSYEVKLESRGKISTTIDSKYPMSINVENSSFMDEECQPDKAIQIRKYYDKVNELIALEEQSIVKDIVKTYNEIDFFDYESITVNFIKTLPDYLFLIADYYNAFEAVLAEVDYLCRFFVDTDVQVLENASVRIGEDEEFCETIFSLVSELAKFSKLISKKCRIRDDYAPSIAWLMIKTTAIKCFANKWINDYGYLFDNNSDEVNLDYYTGEYCHCQDISHKSLSIANSFTYFLMDKGIIPDRNFLECSALVCTKILAILEELEQDSFEMKLMQNKPAIQNKITINDVDLMNGREFEQFTASLFKKMGYEVTVTKHSGDQGIDVIAEKNATKIGIQAKCYSGNVGNSAVQEVVAGKTYYRLDKTIVVTNNFFTTSAIQLAQSNDVILWNRNILIDKLTSL